MAWCNLSWHHVFEKANVGHLVQDVSDHHPILLGRLAKQARCRNDGFRYMEAWNCHPNFKNMVEECLDLTAPNLEAAMEGFKQKILTWNK